MDPARLQAEIDALNPAFNPQRDLINQQLALIPGQTQAAKSGLEQAKVNAFRDVDTNARGRGVYFSGFRPDAQARYIGEKFLPAVANVEAQGLQQQTALQKALNEIAIIQRQQATGNLQGVLDREQRDRQFQAQQAAEQQARAQQAAASRGGGGGGRAAASQGPPPLAQGISQLFQGYRPANQGGEAYYTENFIIPQLMQAYGMSRGDAERTAYSYRKQNFGE